ncbi:MAG: glycosyltransferase family 4 protein [Candidatus Dormibacteria bacterium]
MSSEFPALDGRRDGQRPFTVALVAPPWYPLPPVGYGGIELVVSLLAGGLRARGHQVLLFGAADSDDLVIGLGDTSWRRDLGKVHSQGLRDVTYAARVNAHLADHGQPIDIIHDHSGFSTVAMAAAHTELPIVHTVHGPVTEPLISAVESLTPAVSLVAISASQMRPAPTLPWVAVVPNAIDVKNLEFLPAAAKEPYLLVLARICADKGQHYAIEVARRAGRPLVLAGKIDPGSEAYFEKEIAPHVDGVNVTWRENVGGVDKARLLARATALLAPITWPEPFGLSMVEAMVSGTPTIAFGLGSVPELVVDGATGFVVDTVDQMVDAVARIASIDPARCSLMARNRFSVDAMVDGYLDVYQRVLARTDASQTDAPWPALEAASGTSA